MAFQFGLDLKYKTIWYLFNIDPNNMGFKTNAYKDRMKGYNAWKALWDKMQSQNQTKVNAYDHSQAKAKVRAKG